MTPVRELEAPYENVASTATVSKADQLMRAYRQGESFSVTLLRVRRLEQERRLAGLADTLARIRALKQRPANWDGYHALAPDRRAIVYARAWIGELYRDASSTGHPWRAPHVTSSAEGEVVFEWWNGSKKVTVYISADEATAVRVWGADITAEMDEGDASTATSRRQLWTWLMG
jgi:hypothetical protein